MSVVKVIEVMANSSRSCEDAAQTAVSKAAKSLYGIKSIYVKELHAVVDNDKITEYRITGKISFDLDI